MLLCVDQLAYELGQGEQFLCEDQATQLGTPFRMLLQELDEITKVSNGKRHNRFLSPSHIALEG
jgi:hypothetical protein